MEKKLKVLIADNSNQFATQCQKELETQGYEVSTMENDGAKVFDAIAKQKFDVILMDVFMTNEDPHLIEGVHIERQIIEFALIVSYWRVGIAVKLYNGVDEVPHLLIGGMEDMCAILMHVDALDVLTIDIATQVRSLVNDQTLLALLMSKMGECGSEKTGAYY